MEDENVALQLLAAVRHPGGDELMRRLDIADKIFPWLKAFAWIAGAIFAALLHAEIRLAKIGDNTVDIHDNKISLEAHDKRIGSVEEWRRIMQSAKDGYDVNVVPKIATWDRTAEEWKAFSYGADSDMAHLRKLYWMNDIATKPKL